MDKNCLTCYYYQLLRINDKKIHYCDAYVATLEPNYIKSDCRRHEPKKSADHEFTRIINNENFAELTGVDKIPISCYISHAHVQNYTNPLLRIWVPAFRLMVLAGMTDEQIGEVIDAAGWMAEKHMEHGWKHGQEAIEKT